MTSTPTKYEIRLNLINLMIEFVNECYEDIVPDADHESLLTLLKIYRTDTMRRMKGEHGSLEYMFDNLKVGVRLAGSLMDKIRDEESQSLIGWYHGIQPQNMAQHFFNVLSETALELSWSIMEIESYYPKYKAMFDGEREAYRRIHEQWRIEDEAEQHD